MKNLVDVNPELSQQIVEIIESGNKFDAESLHDAAIEKYAQAWALLPEQKLQWDLSEWLCDCFRMSYMDKGLFGKAKEWARNAIEARPTLDTTSSFIGMGMVCFKLNELDEAFSWFDKAYSLGKHRAFQGEDKIYWQFYKERAGL